MGKVGQGFQFDGFDDYVDMGLASNLLLTNTSMTVAAWVRPTSMALGNGIDEGMVSRYASIGATWMLGRIRDGQWWFVLDTDDTWAPERRVTAPTVAPLNQWQYVVGVYDHSTGALHLYVDGVEVATSSGSPIAVFATPNSHVTLGDWWTYNNGDGGVHAVPGQVDEVRIFTGGSVANAGNQFTADANYTYQYDDNGNLTRKTLLATGNYTQYSSTRTGILWIRLGPRSSRMRIRDRSSTAKARSRPW